VGLLTASQLAAIASGARVRQVWTLLVPQDISHSAFDEVVIHDDAGPEKCVIDAGKRRVTGYNVSFSEPGELRTGDYAFEVSNAGGLFYTANSGGYFASGQYAKPQECRIRHQIYIDTKGQARSALTSWEEVAGVAYEGRILDIRYSDSGGPHGALPGTAVIETENADVAGVLQYKWAEDDGDDVSTGITMNGAAP
jgi:hypothetical protein